MFRNKKIVSHKLCLINYIIKFIALIIHYFLFNTIRCISFEVCALISVLEYHVVSKMMQIFYKKIKSCDRNWQTVVHVTEILPKREHFVDKAVLQQQAAPVSQSNQRLLSLFMLFEHTAVLLFFFCCEDY